MDELELADLLGEVECEWLDFKGAYPGDTVELLHDILCLANSWTDNDRYLVFGVADNKEILGVEADPRRRKSSNINDLLRDSTLNRIPPIRLIAYPKDGHEIDVLKIRNRPDKPFFATKDQRKGGETLRAGVVYTRVGDTNVPLSATAREDEIELMWRERFGIGHSPMQRVSRLIRETDKWQRVQGDEYMYHEDFPEFTIRDDRTLIEDFREVWTQKFPDRSASSFGVDLRYGTTILRKYTFVSCDGGRYRLPLPTLVGDGDRFEINVNSIPWQLAQLYGQYLAPADALKRVGVDLVEGTTDSANLGAG